MPQDVTTVFCFHLSLAHWAAVLVYCLTLDNSCTSSSLSIFWDSVPYILQGPLLNLQLPESPPEDLFLWVSFRATLPQTWHCILIYMCMFYPPHSVTSSICFHLSGAWSWARHSLSAWQEVIDCMKGWVTMVQCAWEVLMNINEFDSFSVFVFSTKLCFLSFSVAFSSLFEKVNKHIL